MQPVAVSPVSRRILLSWLLLLVPAVVLGAVAIQLLRREDDRLTRQGAEIEEARRAALETQTRLIAENIELFSDDVETALLDTLAAVPAEELDGFLAQWERSNPLVRTAFRCAPDGRILRPDPAGGGEGAAGFVRRFARELRERPPWSVAAVGAASGAAVPPAPATARPERESTVSRQALQNVLQTQSARRDLRELAQSREVAPAAVALADTSRLAGGGASVPAMPARVFKAESAANEKRLAPPAPGRRGWWAREVERRWQVLGWVQTGEGEVRGLELQLGVFLARLEGALPVEIAAGQGFVLRDRRAQGVQQRGDVRYGAEPTVRHPLGGGILPGWEVAGFLAPATAWRPGAGFFWVGTVLVGIFVAASVAGGSMLFRQARRSEAEAAQKTSFVASVSHEFKTPLTTIRLYAELLEQGRVRDPAQSADYLRTIGRETQRLARLVNNALDFSRLEQGRRQYVRAPLDLGAELRRMLETHRPRVQEAGLELQAKLPDPGVTVLADRDALEQIVLNLLDNACKYAAAGGEVTVAARPLPGGGAEVRVADRGPGVPPEQRERIFEKFHRIDDALTAEKSGAGLGLSIARELARGLGGSVRCTARDGGGAEFILQLP
jgi:two-component system phosphate regulon sensor histidine kinase PhoR